MDAEDEPIKLLGVNDATLATGEVEPFGFAPTPDFPFATVIAEITPDELEQRAAGSAARALCPAWRPSPDRWPADQLALVKQVQAPNGLLELVVLEGFVPMMGDNRDNSWPRATDAATDCAAP